MQNTGQKEQNVIWYLSHQERQAFWVEEAPQQGEKVPMMVSVQLSA